MNPQAKKRLTLMTFVIIITVAILLATLGSGGASKAISVADAMSGDFGDRSVQVTGTVVDDSYSYPDSSEDAFKFELSDPDVTDREQILTVLYEGAVPATFGNGITTIATGTLDADGVLQAQRLLTKCPSKYESAEGALTVTNLIDNKEALLNTETKVAGYIVENSLAPAGTDERFILTSQGSDISVQYSGALSDEVQEGSSVVVTGSLTSETIFVATDVALEEL